MAIEIKNLKYSYPGQKELIFDLNLEIDLPKKWGIIGPNGSGKTTLLQMMMGLLFPQKGKILFEGVPLTVKKQKEHWKKCGYIYQNSDLQLFMPTLFEELAFTLRSRNLGAKEISEKVDYFLDLFHLQSHRDDMPSQLSDGEKRLASIAGVCIWEPKLLFMDEPTANLSGHVRRHIIHYLKSLECSVVIVSHDLDLIWEVCDETSLFSKGSLIEHGKTSKILKNEELLSSCELELPLAFQTLPSRG